MLNVASLSRVVPLALACALLAPEPAAAAPLDLSSQVTSLVTLSALVGSELGVRGRSSFGLVGEATFGAGSVRALLGEPRASTFHLRLGYDFGAVAGVPLAVFAQYGSFSGVPFGSAQMFHAPPTALGLTLRLTLDR